MPILWLVGMMGSGKTAVGSLVADRIGLPFVDTDTLVEKATGQTIAAIWDTGGEVAFRDLETEQILSVEKVGEDLVVATGGGAVLRAENVSAMQRSGMVVWLTAHPEVLAERLGDAVSRPLLVGGLVGGRLAELLSKRSRGYAAAAHCVVETGGKSPDEVAREVMDLWNDS